MFDRLDAVELLTRERLGRRRRGPLHFVGARIGRAHFHPGHEVGESGIVREDLDRRLTISYMMNRMAGGILGSDRAESYIRAVYDAVG